jgi:SAM-dependent methyltransferase
MAFEPSASTLQPASARHLRDVTRYYTWLDRWVRWSRAVRPWSGFDSMTVHRLLTDPVSGENGPLVLHRLMLDGFALAAEPRVLDAGCGYGGTAFDLQARIGGDWLGLTISPIQLARARAESVKRGVSDRVRFALESYDVPRGGPFDLVIGIESLVHSSDPDATIANLGASLASGGSLVLVDDMPVEPFPASLAADLATFKRTWRAPVMPSERGWRRAFERAGLEVIASDDYSGLIWHRPVEELTRLIERDLRRARYLSWTGMRAIPEANIGGLVLERLAVAGAVQYRRLVGRKR